ncbi:MAG: DUF3494 domain-containing protein [Archangiaceae bacterium]|nr:DUF3494 domain-containing protein [Archangiaceae bacterium]
MAVLWVAACGRPPPAPVALGAAAGFSVLARGGLTSAPTATVLGDVGEADATDALAALEAAATDARSREPDITALDRGAMVDRTLTPGVYRWDSSVRVTSELRLDGSVHDAWVLQVAGDLVLAPETRVRLFGDPPLSDRIVWLVAGDVNLGEGAHLEGVVLAAGSVTLQPAASLHGRALTLDAALLGDAAQVAP